MNLKSVAVIGLALAFSLAAQTNYQSMANRAITGSGPYPFATNVYLQTSDFTVPSAGPMIPEGIVCRDSGTVAVITIVGDSCKLSAKTGLNWFPVQVQKIISSGTDSILRFSSITLYGTVTTDAPYTGLATPAAPVLSTPSSGSTNQPLSMSFSWATGQKTSAYTVYISTSSAFSSTVSVYNTSSSYLKTVSVPSSSALYWRAVGNTIAGSGPWSSTWNFGTTL
jgi:hypothetical protein